MKTTAHKIIQSQNIRTIAEPLARIHYTTSQLTSALPPFRLTDIAMKQTLTSAVIDSREQ